MAGSMFEALEQANLVTPQMRQEAQSRGNFNGSTQNRRQKELAQKDRNRFNTGICTFCSTDQKFYRDKETNELVIAPHHFEHELCPGSHQPPEKPIEI